MSKRVWLPTIRKLAPYDDVPAKAPKLLAQCPLADLERQAGANVVYGQQIRHRYPLADAS